ncbi:MAG: MOSC domain-containing protein, partial [Alphaproteobacteria bacterium]
MIIDELWQFPVKGLCGIRLDSADLVAGRHFPGDRQFAITAGHPKFADMPDGSWQKKAAFLQLM